MAEAMMPDGTTVIIPDPNGMPCCNKTLPTMPRPSRAEVWAMFAAKLQAYSVKHNYTSEWVGNRADDLLAEYDKRWSNDNGK